MRFCLKLFLVVTTLILINKTEAGVSGVESQDTHHHPESVTCQSLCDEYTNALKLDRATYNGGEAAWTKNVAQKKRVIDHNGCNLVCGGGRMIGSIIVLLISFILF